MYHHGVIGWAWQFLSLLTIGFATQWCLDGLSALLSDVAEVKGRHMGRGPKTVLGISSLFPPCLIETWF